MTSAKLCTVPSSAQLLLHSTECLNQETGEERHAFGQFQGPSAYSEPQKVYMVTKNPQSPATLQARTPLLPKLAL